MKKYNVLISNHADIDISNIHSYICNNLKAKASAKKIIFAIIKSIRSLEHFPERHQLRNEDFLKKEGIRSYNVGHYIILYKIIKDDVIVLRVIYNKSDFTYIII